MKKLKVFKLHSTALVFLTAISWFFLHQLAYWPGMLTWDFVNYVAEILIFEKSLGQYCHEAWIYSLFLKIALIPRAPWLVISLQIILGAAVISYGYHLLANKLGMKKSGKCAAALAVFLPLNPLMAILPERDVLYAYFLLAILLLLVDITFALGAKIWKLFLLCIFTAIAACLKSEGLIFLLLIPLQLIFLHVVNFKQLAFFTSGLSVLAFLLVIIAPFWIGIANRLDFENSANIKPFYYPVLYIASQKSTQVSEVDKEVIIKVLGPDSLSLGQFKYFTEVNDWPGASKKEKAAFLHLAMAWVIQNPLIFLQSRWVWFWNMFDWHFLYNYDPHAGNTGKAAPGHLDAWRNFQLQLDNSRLPSFYRINQSAWNYLDASGSAGKILTRPGFGIFFLLLLSVFSLAWRKTFLISLIPLMQLIVAFLLGTSANPKYIYIVYLTPIFLLPIAAREFMKYSR